MVQPDLDRRRLVRLLPDLELLSDTFRVLDRKSSPLAPVLDELATELARRPLT